MRALIVVSVALAACSGQKPTADEVLQKKETVKPSDPVAARRVSLQETVNREARAAREAARARPEDADAQVAAAAALFVAADLELRRGLIADLDRDPPEDVDELLDREDDLPGELKARIVALCDEGTAFASAAVALDGKRPDARFYYAACLGLSAWGKGAAAALFQGLAPKIKQGIVDAVAADPSFADGAPLRALGAFYSRAPWPVGDKDEAREAFSKIRKKNALTLLYVAELYWRTGDHGNAVTHWKLIEKAVSDPLTRSAPFVREFARRAVALATK